MADLSGKKIAFLVSNDGIEQSELEEPWKAVKQAGATPELIATKEGVAQARVHLEKSKTFPVDTTTTKANPAHYDGLVIPGGVANPDALRMDQAAVSFVRGMFDAGKPVAAICHGPWMLVEANVIRGRTLTSWPSLQTDIRNAGGTWVDEEVVVDNNGPNVLITSRKPDDLPAFNEKLIEVFEKTHSMVS
jgi:protease I